VYSDSPQKSAVLARDQVEIGLAENGGDPTQAGCASDVKRLAPVCRTGAGCADRLESGGRTDRRAKSGAELRAACASTCSKNSTGGYRSPGTHIPHRQTPASKSEFGITVRVGVRDQCNPTTVATAMPRYARRGVPGRRPEPVLRRSQRIHGRWLRYPSWAAWRQR
jgi:hypothetical protein